jgi:hypothetical protein
MTLDTLETEYRYPDILLFGLLVRNPLLSSSLDIFCAMKALFRAGLDRAGQNCSQRDFLSALHNWGPFCLPAAYVLWTIGPTVTAPLTLWDHWIAYLVGSDGRMTIHATVNNIHEFALDPADNMRFRPLYWVLYLGEIYFYGDWALSWRLTRLAAALWCGILLYTTARRWLSSPAASVVALSFFSGNQCEAWIRLGLQEGYGMPLLLAGLAWIAVRLEAGRSAPSELLIGYLGDPFAEIHLIRSSLRSK